MGQMVWEAVVPAPAVTAATPAIELRDVTKRFRTPSGDIYTALRDLNLTVGAGEFVSVVGPTGCGKSTTLALISGLTPASSGEVLVQAREWIAKVGLSGFEDHYPHQLSGGMRKRTALAQSLITSPELILMD